MHHLRLFIIALALCVCGVCAHASAQWQPTTGISHNRVFSLLTLESSVLAGTDTGIYLSTDNGENWTATFPGWHTVICLYTDGSAIYAALYDHDIIVSHDGGHTWSAVGSFPRPNSISGIVVHGQRILAATSGQGLQISDNNGETWTRSEQLSLRFSSIVSDGTTLFLTELIRDTTKPNLLRSTDNGNTWTRAAVDEEYVFIQAVYRINSTFFAVSDGVLYRSTDGSNWTKIPTGNFTAQYVISKMAYHNGMLFATSGSSVYASTDNGTTWALHTTPGQYINCLGVIGSKVAVGLNMFGLQVFEAGNSVGTPLNRGFVSTSDMRDLHASRNGLYSASQYDSTLYSLPQGTTWQFEAEMNWSIIKLTSQGDRFIASRFRQNGNNPSVIVLSDDGRNWYTPDTDASNSLIRAFLATEDIILAGGAPRTDHDSGVAGAAYSTDGGRTWTSADMPAGVGVAGFALHKNTFFMASDKGTFRSDDGKEWVSAGDAPIPNFSVSAFASNQSNLFRSHISFTSIPGRGISVSDDDGATWFFPEEGLPEGGVGVFDFAVHGHYVFAGGAERATDLVASRSAVYLSDDNGISWKNISDNLPGSEVRTLEISDGYLYAGTLGAAVWRRPLSELITTSVADNTPEQFQYELLPHPVNSSSVLRLCSTCELHNATLTLSTTGGQRVRTTGNLYGTSVAIEKGGLAAGVYAFTLEEAGRVVTAGTIVIE